MAIVSIVSAGDGDLVAGVFLGLCLGVLIGPVFRTWLAAREWIEASREVRLADRLLERMEIDEDPADRTEGADDEPASLGSTWRT